MDLKLSNRNRDYRHGLNDAIKELRAIAEEYDCSVVATHQGNRQAMDARTITARHVGESLGVMQTADTAISLNQTNDEYQLAKMRIFIMRARNQRKWGLIEILQNLEIGQFCQASVILNKEEQENE